MTKPDPRDAVVEVVISVPREMTDDFRDSWKNIVQDIIAHAEIKSAKMTIPPAGADDVIELETW